MKHLLQQLLLYFFTSMVCINGYAKHEIDEPVEPFIIKSYFESENLTAYIRSVRALPNELSLQQFNEILNSDRAFHSSGRYSDKTLYWKAFNLQNQGMQNQFVIQIENALVSQAHFYLKGEDGVIMELKGPPDPERFYPYAFFSLAPKAHSSLLVSYSSEIFTDIPLNIYTEASFYKNEKKRLLLWGLFIATIFIVLIFSLAIYKGTKNPVYLAFSGYLIGVFFIGTFTVGYGEYLLSREITSLARGVSQLFTIGFTLLFLGFYFKLGETAVKLNSRIIQLSVFIFIVALCALFLPKDLSFRLFVSFQAITIVLAITVALFQLKEAKKPSHYYLISWIPFLSGSILSTAAFMGKISFITPYEALVHGFLLQILFLVFGLVERQAEERRAIHRLTHLNHISQLPNRNALIRDLSHLIKQRQPFGLAIIKHRDSGELLASIGIKYIGQVMRSAAMRLKRESNFNQDAIEIYHFESTLLAVVIKYEPVAPRWDRLLEQWRKLLCEPVDVDRLSVALDCSIGVALYPQTSDEMDKLIQRALLSERNAEGLSERYKVHTSGEGETVLERNIKIISAIEEALSGEELPFRIYHQPQINLLTGEHVGSEVLLRWNHSEYGNIPTETFIRLAEQTGSITRLTERMINIALEQQQKILEVHPQNQISINLSALDLLMQKSVDNIIHRVSEYKIPVDQVTLELTETLSIQYPHIARLVMERFRRERFNIAIDDFGTGHASLSNLVKFPFNRIKIDRSLIKNIDKKWRDATLVKNILVLAKELDITVTAEGIETENIHNHLKEIGCEYAQGQYYAHPMTLDDYLCWIKNYQAIESNKPSLPQTSILVKIADPLSIS